MGIDIRRLSQSAQRQIAQKLSESLINDRRETLSASESNYTGKNKNAQRGSKYGNKKCSVDGIEFDSKKEARRYQELKLLNDAGKIKDLRRQVKYVLIPAAYTVVDGKRKCIERECCYLADFVYYDVEKDSGVVEDTKGMRTKDYIIKRKLMLKEFGIRISEV